MMVEGKTYNKLVRIFVLVTITWTTISIVSSITNTGSKQISDPINEVMNGIERLSDDDFRNLRQFIDHRNMKREDDDKDDKDKSKDDNKDDESKDDNNDDKSKDDNDDDKNKDDDDKDNDDKDKDNDKDNDDKDKDKDNDSPSSPLDLPIVRFFLAFAAILAINMLAICVHHLYLLASKSEKSYRTIEHNLSPF